MMHITYPIYSHKNRTIALSIAIHIFVLMWLLGFFEIRHIKKIYRDSNQEQTSIPKPYDPVWASTKARRTSAPVIFSQTAAPIQQAISSPATTSTALAQHQQEPTAHDDSIQEDMQPQNETAKPTTTQPSQTPSLFVQAARNALYAKAQTVRRATQTRTPAPQTSHQSTHQSNRMPTMAQIAQGLSTYADEEGEYTINVIGDPRKLPTEQQLKQHHYVEKLLNCLHASYVTMKNKEPMITPQSLNNPRLTMLIHRDGSMSDLRIVSGSQYACLDDFCIALFTDAGHSFPPLPSYFEHDSYRMNWVIMLK